jgi:hypothetical protein
MFEKAIRSGPVALCSLVRVHARLTLKCGGER